MTLYIHFKVRSIGDWSHASKGHARRGVVFRNVGVEDLGAIDATLPHHRVAKLESNERLHASHSDALHDRVV